MKKLMKNCLAAAMALALCVSLLPMTVFAEEADLGYDAPETVSEPVADPEPCEHEWKVVAHTAPCGKSGEITTRCTKCGDTKTYTGVLTHQYGSNVKTPQVDPTCTEDGKKEHYTCELCGKDFLGTKEGDGLILKRLGHSFGGWIETKAATCTADGEEKHDCTRDGCNESETRTIDALGHSWDEGTVTQEPTATEKGVMTYTCTRTGCEATRTEDIDPVPDTTEPDEGETETECAHENGAWISRGEHFFSCSVCGKNVFYHTPTEADCLTGSHCPYEDCWGNVEGAKNPENHAEACEPSYVDNGDSTHDQIRTCGAVVVDDEAHEDADGDHYCDDCGAELEEESKEPVGPTKKDDNTWTWTSPEGTVVTVTLNSASASGHSATIFRTVQVSVDGNGNSAMSIDGVNKGYGKNATMSYYIDPSVDTTKTVSVSVGQYSFTVEFDMTQGIEVIADHHYEGDWIVDKEATETEEGHAYRTCTVKTLAGKDCPVKEEMTIPMLEGGDGDDGDTNQGGGNGGTTPTTPTNPGTTTGGSVTDPDPVDSGVDLTTIEEEEVPLAGLPFDLEATDELTRGLVAQILYWFEGEPDADQSSFTDVPADHEYAQAIAWGDANGILLGSGDGTYRPDNCITREEMELILNRYARYKGSELVIELDGEPDDLMIWAEAEEILNDFFDRLSGEEV